MSYFLIVRYRPVRETSLALSERTWVRVLATLNEYQARLFVAEKALLMGRGGASHLSQLTGMCRVTITQGLTAVRAGRNLRAATSGRMGQPGRGRKKVEQAERQLPPRLRKIVEEASAGDPMSPLKWANKSA